jgi:hypothetical protein
VQFEKWLSKALDKGARTHIIIIPWTKQGSRPNKQITDNRIRAIVRQADFSWEAIELPGFVVCRARRAGGWPGNGAEP